MTDHVTKYTSDRRKEGSRAREPRWAVFGSWAAIPAIFFNPDLRANRGHLVRYQV